MPPGEGAVLPDLAAATARGGGRGMHADVVIVLDGALSIELDGSVEVALSAGDCLVQLRARHVLDQQSGARYNIG